MATLEQRRLDEVVDEILSNHRGERPSDIEVWRLARRRLHSREWLRYPRIMNFLLGVGILSEANPPALYPKPTVDDIHLSRRRLRTRPGYTRHYKKRERTRSRPLLVHSS